jgi:hypothetical protein
MRGENLSSAQAKISSEERYSNPAVTSVRISSSVFSNDKSISILPVNFLTDGPAIRRLRMNRTL